MVASTFLALARRQIEAHPATGDVGAVEIGDGRASISFDLDLGFGARWIAEGRSPTGVLPVERVRLDFPDDYPLSPPEPSYRSELGRNMAHVQSWVTDDRRPVPCLTAMPAAEFIATEGLTAYVEQFVVWLRGAAEDRLAAGVDGWEPSRREGVENSIIVDRAALRALTDNLQLARDGAAWLQTSFLMRPEDDCAVGKWFAEIGPLSTIEAGLGIRDAGDGLLAGRGLALALWATSLFGDIPVFGRYEPDDVADIGQLIAKAERLGVGYKLRFELRKLKRLGWSHSRISVPLFVVFLVRRPCPLLGETSPVEILPYVVPVAFPGGCPIESKGAVRPLLARDRIEVGLLRRLSGAEPLQVRWAALGAGSLGSKLTLHLSRAGHPPVVIIDHAVLQPHQVARHALYPSFRHSDIGWYGPKADALAETAMRITRTQVGAVSLDAVAALPELEELAAIGPTPLVVVNTTASIVAREELAALASPNIRLVDAELHDQGLVGTLRIEGPERNPNISELAGSFMLFAHEKRALGAHLFKKENRLSQVAIGEGCSSTTMVLNDASLSLQGAAIGLALERTIAQPPAIGRIEVWLRRNGGLEHDAREIGAFVRVGLDDGWTLSVSPDVSAAIAEDLARYPNLETGGVLVGRVSVVAQSIQALTLLPAPPDSERRADFFKLGVEGLEEAKRDLRVATDGMLYVVGTWHSHLGDAAPSQTDRQTAARLGAHAPYPLALLIRGANGYRGLFAGPTEPT